MAGLKVIILAAGKSTRMRSTKPKVLHEVAGQPILRYVLDQALSLDPDEIVCVVGHESGRVRAAFDDFPRLSFATQERQLGTAHAVVQAASFLEDFSGDVLILCGDVPLLRHETLDRFRREFRAGGFAASVLTAVYDDPTGYGRIVRDSSGRLRQIVEEKDAPPELKAIQECNTGTYLFDAGFLMPTLQQISTNNAQGEYYLTDAVAVLGLTDRDIGTTLVDDPHEVIGVNNRRDLAIADAVARGWIMRDLLENGGVTLVDPATTYIDAGVEIGEDTIIRPFTCIRSGVRIGRECDVGPFAHLRPGTVLDDGSKVGAFVETKNAHLLAGAKAGHMAYLGDVTVGKKANIGAGTIVANYDGKEKHLTEIGDGAFIGCGTVLVAPVKVGKNATTGANTVVPKNRNVPDGATVVGAPARELKRAGDGKGSASS
jgi:bifunctional UDP-N-acetylglucosamine pyrophosphorylase/glucosamine-1-phosphate N-acetyltransferase